MKARSATGLHGAIIDLDGTLVDTLGSDTVVDQLDQIDLAALGLGRGERC